MYCFQKISTVKQPSDRNLPAVHLSCKCLDANLIRPMYPRRLVRTACQLPHLPEHMFNCCHVRCSIRVSRYSCDRELRKRGIVQKCDPNFDLDSKVSAKRTCNLRIKNRYIAAQPLCDRETKWRTA